MTIKIYRDILSVRFTREGEKGMKINEIILEVLKNTQKVDGRKKTQSDIASALGVKPQVVNDRLKNENMKVNTAIELLEEMGYEIVQTCGEPGFESTPCISQMDIDILGLSDSITLEGNKGQRASCNCPSNKRSLLKWENKNSCKHECLYCYMKNFHN